MTRRTRFREVSRKAADRPSPRRVVTDGYGDVMQRKEDLVAELAGVSTLRDFGGCYIVEGRYLLEPARRLGATFVSMVDHGDTAAYDQRAASLAAEMPDTRFETVNGDFREPSLYARLEPVDASILFEVVLHQENYVQVVKDVTSVTTKYVVVAQPCLRESLFLLPSSATLLQFWPEALKDELRSGSFWPKEEPTRRFWSASWMWGHTTSHMIDVFGGFGWELDDAVVVDDVAGDYWEYPLLRFRSPA